MKDSGWYSTKKVFPEFASSNFFLLRWRTGRRTVVSFVCSWFTTRISVPVLAVPQGTYSSNSTFKARHQLRMWIPPSNRTLIFQYFGRLAAEWFQATRLWCLFLMRFYGVVDSYLSRSQFSDSQLIIEAIIARISDVPQNIIGTQTPWFKVRNFEKVRGYFDTLSTRALRLIIMVAPLT